VTIKWVTLATEMPFAYCVENSIEWAQGKTYYIISRPLRSEYCIVFSSFNTIQPSSYRLEERRPIL